MLKHGLLSLWGSAKACHQPVPDIQRRPLRDTAAMVLSLLNHTTTYNATAAYQANLASQQRLANFSQALQEEKNIKQMGYLKKNTIYPGESVSGYVHVERIKGERVVFVVNIEGAEYVYEWRFDKKATYLID